MTEALCPNCEKATDLCVCAAIRRLPTRLHVLILQHPQEPDHELGTARLAHLSLPNSTLKIGLSWPNLKAALGREAQPSRWAALYLGSGVKGTKASGVPIHFVTKQGTPVREAVSPDALEGVVVLDGTWSQAKALWWRNAWLLKLRRVILDSPEPSLYRELRREPRRECLSTIESIGATLQGLGEPASVREALNETFQRLLDRKRATRPAKKRDFRRR